MYSARARSYTTTASTVLQCVCVYPEHPGANIYATTTTTLYYCIVAVLFFWRWSFFFISFYFSFALEVKSNKNKITTRLIYRANSVLCRSNEAPFKFGTSRGSSLDPHFLDGAPICSSTPPSFLID
jgi:hypothetical protein